MKIKLFTSKNKNEIIHFTVFITILYIIFEYVPYSKIETTTGGIYDWVEFVFTLLILVSFYIHSLVLLPILLKKKQVKKFLIFVFAGLIFYLLFAYLIYVIKNSIIHNESGELKLNFENVFLNSRILKIKNFILLIVIYIPFSFISLVYYLLSSEKEHRKEVFSSEHMELIVNIIIVVSIFFMFWKYTYIPLHSQAFIIVLISVFLFYCNVFWLTSMLLVNKQINKYIIISLILLIALIIGVVLYKRIEFKEGNILVGVDLLEIGFRYVILITAAFIYGYLRHRIKNLDKKLNAKESELQLLKSQVNPHFLFNTLNTLYAIALREKAEKTAESTAKLASLIRYMQKDINKDFIPLKNEIKYLQDYITIQKLRCAIAPQIDTEFVNIEKHVISPGLLIPFVENAFKYGIDPSKESKLKVSVICDEKSINFECENSYDQTYKTYHKEEGFGIGIKNASQRLALVYPEKHTFEIVKEKNKFLVKIDIHIKK